MTNTTAGNQTAETDFESLRLYPGDTMQIQVAADTSPVHHWVKFIGYIKDSCLLTTLPFKYAEGMWILKGEEFVIRGFNGRFAYAFTTEVICEYTAPFSFIVFSWPRSIESRVVRKTLRVDVTLPVNVSLLDNTVISAVLHDLSVSGAMVDSSVEIGRIGDHVQTELIINFDGNTEKVSVPATIRNIHHKEDEKGFKFGVEFNNITQNERLILNYFIDSVEQPR